MKKNIISLILGLLTFVLFMTMTHCASAQETMMGKNIIKYNKEKNDWDLVIPLLEGVTPNPNYVRIVSAGHGIDYPTQITQRGFELKHPSVLSFRAGAEYWFYAEFLDENLVFYRTDFLKIFAPDIEIKSYQKVEGLFILPIAVVYMNEEIASLVINRENTYFSFVPPNSKGVWEQIKVEANQEQPVFSNKDSITFSGFQNLWENSSQKYHQFFNLQLDDGFGNPKLYGSSYTNFLKGYGLKIANNVSVEGAIIPYFGTGREEHSFVLNLEGRIILSLKLKSGEPFWPSSYKIYAGQYFLYIPDVGIEKFTVVNY